MDKNTSYFQLLNEDERQKKIDEFQILDEELKSLHKNARVYQSHGSSSLFFIADREKIHSETKLRVKKLTDLHDKLKK